MQVRPILFFKRLDKATLLWSSPQVLTPEYKNTRSLSYLTIEADNHNNLYVTWTEHHRYDASRSLFIYKYWNVTSSIACMSASKSTPILKNLSNAVQSLYMPENSTLPAFGSPRNIPVILLRPRCFAGAATGIWACELINLFTFLYYIVNSEVVKIKVAA